MNFMGIIGLVIGVVILAVCAYKGVGALPLSILASIAVIIFNRMNIWEAFSQFYMSGYTSFIMQNFILFVSTSLFARIMDETGAAVAVAYKFIDWFGKKRVMLIIYIVTCILTYGGISVFVVIWAMRPIMVVLCKETNLPLHLTTAARAAGSSAISLSTLPGTPSLTNVIPTRYLGTSLTAAPILSIFATIIMGGLNYYYCIYAEKKCRAKGEGFEYNAVITEKDYGKDYQRSELPNAGMAFIPLLIVIFINIFLRDAVSSFGINSTMLVIIALLIASAVALLFWGRKIKSYKLMFNKGLGDAVPAISSPCGVVAFGSVVSNAAAFQSIVNWVTNLNINPYIYGSLATAVICGITGSSSGGITIAMDNFAERLLATGANPEIMHRLCTIAAGTLDTLPHAAGIFATLGLMGLTHKNSYVHCFWTSVAVPIITLAIMLAVVILMGL